MSRRRPSKTRRNRSRPYKCRSPRLPGRRHLRPRPKPQVIRSRVRPPRPPDRRLSPGHQKRSPTRHFRPRAISGRQSRRPSTPCRRGRRRLSATTIPSCRTYPRGQPHPSGGRSRQARRPAPVTQRLPPTSARPPRRSRRRPFPRPSVRRPRAFQPRAFRLRRCRPRLCHPRAFRLRRCRPRLCHPRAFRMRQRRRQPVSRRRRYRPPLRPNHRRVRKSRQYPGPRRARL